MTEDLTNLQNAIEQSFRRHGSDAISIIQEGLKKFNIEMVVDNEIIYLGKEDDNGSFVVSSGGFPMKALYTDDRYTPSINPTNLIDTSEDPSSSSNQNTSTNTTHPEQRPVTRTNNPFTYITNPSGREAVCTVNPNYHITAKGPARLNNMLTSLPTTNSIVPPITLPISLLITTVLNTLPTTSSTTHPTGGSIVLPANNTIANSATAPASAPTTLPANSTTNTSTNPTANPNTRPTTSRRVYAIRNRVTRTAYASIYPPRDDFRQVRTQIYQSWVTRLMRNYGQNMNRVLTARANQAISSSVPSLRELTSRITNETSIVSVDNYLVSIEAGISRNKDSVSFTYNIYLWFKYLLYSKLRKTPIFGLYSSDVSCGLYKSIIKHGQRIDSIFKFFGLVGILCVEMFPKLVFKYSQIEFDQYLRFLRNSGFFRRLNVDTESLKYLGVNVPNHIETLDI